MNKRGICLSQLTEESSVQILTYCDASDTGYGCNWTNNSVDEKALDCYAFRNGWEIKQSSTWRELEAIKRVLEQSVDNVKNRTVASKYCYEFYRNLREETHPGRCIKKSRFQKI